MKILLYTWLKSLNSKSKLNKEKVAQRENIPQKVYLHNFTLFFCQPDFD